MCMIKQIINICFFYDLTCIHNCYFIANIGNNP